MKYSMIRKQIFPAFLLSIVLAACPGSTCGAEESMAEESLSFSEEIISDELFEDWSVPEEEPAGISPDDFGQSGFAEDNHEVASGAKTAVPAEDEGTEDVYTPDGSDELIEDESNTTNLNHMKLYYKKLKIEIIKIHIVNFLH